MRMFHCLAASFLLTFLSGCHSEKPTSDQTDTVYYAGQFDLQTTRIPFRFLMSDSSITLVNGEERIQLTYEENRGDTAVYRFPQYDSYFGVLKSETIKGWWQPSAASGKPRITFSAQPDVYFSDLVNKTDSIAQYQCEFHYNDSSFAFDAVAKIQSHQKAITGTFLTRTGDFRFLQGEKSNNAFWLSTFDGDHLYFAKGTIENEIISDALFYSGVKPPYFWSGSFTQTPSIADPDSLTFITGSSNKFQFVVQNFNGDSVRFDSTDYHDKVTVVSIFGSWCPNCHDELKMYAELLSDMNEPNLRVLPVAFERGDELETAHQAVKRVKQYTGFEEECYYGGKSSKTAAQTVFPQLNEVIAFPTSIFIDKSGNVRKIHTGFNGPGTGERYSLYKKEIADFLKDLLNE